MMIFRKKSILTIIAILALGLGAVSYAIPQTGLFGKKGIQATEITGLLPNAEIHYDVVYNPDGRPAGKAGEETPQRSRGIVIADENGRALLPPMQRAFINYSFEIPHQGKTITIEMDHDPRSGNARIKTSGLEKFSNIQIGDPLNKLLKKSDWAGIFSQSDIIDYSKGADYKLAFAGMGLPGNSIGKNPAVIEVVVAVGGGPTPALVNIYDPPIGLCGAPIASTDGASVFQTSTCNEPRMETHIEGFGPGTVAYNIALPMMAMAEELTAVMMQQMQIIGGFIDAAEQNETQRDIRALTAQANKDYHPSEQLCRFGTFIRSVSNAEHKGDLNREALSNTLSTFYNNAENMSSSEGFDMDMKSRIELFRSTYCDPNELGGTLWEFCRHEENSATPTSPSGSNAARDRYNKDIDVYQSFLKPLTINVDFNSGIYNGAEFDMIALGKNLYWPVSPNPGSPDKLEQGHQALMAMRQIAAMHNVAHNSFTNMVGMKSRTNNTLGVQSGSAYMKSFLRELGFPSDDDIHEYMGPYWGETPPAAADNFSPSYYAQMEILTKKIYQDPTFYTNLYDKPVNVERINGALEAIQLMHGRDRYESLLRQEMLLSLLVEQGIIREADTLNGRLLGGTQQYYTINPTGP